MTEHGGQYRYTPVADATKSALHSFHAANGDQYVIPAIAVPFLGHGLDLSLFDVSTLVAKGEGARIPVDLTFAAGGAPSAPPGVTVTSTTGSSASGYVTARSAAAFGAALRQSIAEQGRAAGLPDAVVKLSAQGQPAPANVVPFYPMRLLPVNATDLNNAPVDTFVYLQNLDSTNALSTLVPLSGGEGRIQVPAGHYAAVGYFSDFDGNGQVTDNRQVVEYLTVPDTGTVPPLTVAETAATTPVTATTPRPSVANAVSANVVLGDHSGVWNGAGDNLDGIPLYVNPMPAPATGAMHYVVQWAGSATNAADHYRYDLAFPSDNGIPADEHYTARLGQLATVRQNFFTDPTSTGSGQLILGATDPTMRAANALGSGSMSTPMPGTLTDYLGTADGGAWQQLDVTPAQLFLIDSFRVFTARTRLSRRLGTRTPCAAMGSVHGSPKRLLRVRPGRQPRGGRQSRRRQ